MRDMPNIEAEVREYFETLKTMLVQNAKDGHQFTPVFIMVTLTPDAQSKLEQPELIMLVLKWENNDDGKSKELCLRSTIEFLNRYAECAILCGSGRGLYTEYSPTKFAGEVNLMFVTVYMPGYKSWSLAQTYTVIEREVLFDAECSTTTGNILPIELPGLWPNEAAS